jgi:prepilin-type N-terminal cleavage/methylation domain-containing protein
MKPHHDKGFSLIELMVVSVLMVLVATMSAQMWRYFRAQAADLTSRTRTAQELRMALESLADDMGSVVWAIPVDPTHLLVCRQAPGAPTRVTIEYSLDAGQLVRLDQSTGIAIPVADCVSAFSVRNATEEILQIDIAIRSGGTTHRSTLFWSRA